MNSATTTKSGTIVFDTTRFGSIRVEEDKVIHFVHGIPGFTELKRYILIDHDTEGVFRWLQAVDRPEVAFLLTNPMLFKEDYNVTVRHGELKALGAEDTTELVTFVMVCFDRKNRRMTLNLKGPVVLNPLKMRGVQLILDREDYPVDYPVPIRDACKG